MPRDLLARQPVDLLEGKDLLAMRAPEPKKENISAPEAFGRGVYYGGWQQPRDVAAAGVARIFGGVPFKEGLEQAKGMSLEGRQGAAQSERPGWFGTGQVAGNIGTTFLPASGVTKAVGNAAPFLEAIPAVGSSLANIAKATGASSGLIGTPLSGALQGAVMSGMTEGDTSGAIPGAVGASSAALISKILNPIGQGAISKARQSYTKILQAAGIDDLTPGQITGNKGLELLDSVLNEMLPTAGAARKRTEGQLLKFTKAAMEKAGITADDFSPAVREMAESEFNKKYSELVAGTVVKVDAQLLKTLSDVESGILQKLPTNVKPIVQSYLSDIMNSGGKITGNAYQQARSQLSQQARSLSTTDSFTAGALRTIRNALDDAAERSLPETKQGAWKTLNRQYANYKILQKAASSVSKDSLEGLIPPTALNRAVEVANKTKSQKGYGDLYELSRAGRSVLPDSVPNSGTAQRQWAQALLGGGVGLGTYGVTQDPETALAAGAGAIALPKAAQYLLNTPAARQYLTQGIPYMNKAITPAEKQFAALLAAAQGGN